MKTEYIITGLISITYYICCTLIILVSLTYTNIGAEYRISGIIIGFISLTSFKVKIN